MASGQWSGDGAADCWRPAPCLPVTDYFNMAYPSSAHHLIDTVKYTVIFIAVNDPAFITLPDLVEAAAAAMDDWPAPANGQVRALPDVRTLRWYGTIGLLDRPSAWRGRTALYGRRHLLQVLAIKRLQLAGWPIAAIQQRLYGTSDADLTTIAGSSAPAAPLAETATADTAKAEAPAPAAAAPAPGRRAAAFWQTAPADPVAPTAVARLHLPLGGDAELILPPGTDTTGLDAALAPLRAWLADHLPTSERTP